MIGKGKCISHTKASMSYGWNEEKDAKIIYKNHLLGDNPSELTKEFKRIQMLNINCKRNTISFVLSPTIEDGKKLNRQTLHSITKSFIDDMKLGDRQAIAFVHNDKHHKHIHLYVNRINFQGEAYQDSYIGKRSQKAAERVAKLLELKTVKEVNQEKLQSLKQLRKEIYKAHQDVVKFNKPRTFNEYLRAMKQHNITLIPSINKSNQLQGFRIKYKGLDLKASEVHRNMSILNLTKLIYKSNTMALCSYKNPKVNILNQSISLNPNIILKLGENISNKIKQFQKH